MPTVDRVHERSRRWFAEQWQEWQPRTRVSTTEALARFITIAVEHGARMADVEPAGRLQRRTRHNESRERLHHPSRRIHSWRYTTLPGIPYRSPPTGHRPRHMCRSGRITTAQNFVPSRAVEAFPTARMTSRWPSFKPPRSDDGLSVSGGRSPPIGWQKSLLSSLQLGVTRHHELTRAGLSSQLRGTEQHQLDGWEGPPRSTTARIRSSAS